MTLEQVPEFLAELGLAVSHDWVRKQAEPDANKKRGFPVFKLTPGIRAPLYTSDEAILTYFRALGAQALNDVRGAENLAKVLQEPERTESQGEESQGVRKRLLAPRRG